MISWARGIQVVGTFSIRSSTPAAFASLVQGAFRGLGEGLFDHARGAPWTAWGILDRSGRPEAAVDFALRLLDEQKPAKSGRWLPFNGKALKPGKPISRSGAGTWA